MFVHYQAVYIIKLMILCSAKCNSTSNGCRVFIVCPSSFGDRLIDKGMRK
jgi:hypothetical protein